MICHSFFLCFWLDPEICFLSWSNSFGDDESLSILSSWSTCQQCCILCSGRKSTGEQRQTSKRGSSKDQFHLGLVPNTSRHRPQGRNTHSAVWAPGGQVALHHLPTGWVRSQDGTSQPCPARFLSSHHWLETEQLQPSSLGFLFQTACSSTHHEHTGGEKATNAWDLKFSFLLLHWGKRSLDSES